MSPVIEDKIYISWNESNVFRYLVSIYWAFSTMTSVGYGDIVPQPNVSELVVAIISMIIGAILFAHFVGALIDIVLGFSPEVCFLF